MKKKTVFSLLVIVMALLLSMTLIACGRTTTPDNNSSSTFKVTPLADLKNYGNVGQYYSKPEATYESAVKTAKIADLKEKQKKERQEAINRMKVSGSTSDNEWNDDNIIYYTFAEPYFAEDNKWQSDHTDSTVTRVFCYANMDELMGRIAKAGIPQKEMTELVAYIVREDILNDGKKREAVDKHKFARYEINEGKVSAIADYNDLDEISYVLNNWDVVSNNSNTLDGKEENDWKDLKALKRRKINGELFKIFGDNADMFARFLIHMTSFEYQVLETVIQPLYYSSVQGLATKEEINDFVADKVIGVDTAKLTNDFQGVDILDYNKAFVFFMKEAMMDYEQAVYLLAFKNSVRLSDDTYLANTEEVSDMMTLQGFNYQYQKNDYSVWKDRAEYEKYLKLSRKDTLSATEAKEYRNLDARHYLKAYRYKDTFYDLYYEQQLKFQRNQEVYEAFVFMYNLPDDVNNSDFYGAFNKGIDFVVESSKPLSYVKQLQLGLKNHKGPKYSLLIGDGNHDYMHNDQRLLRYNEANTAWNGLNSAAKKEDANRIHEVLLQCKQLQIQSHLMGLSYLSGNDFEAFKEFLAFQQYSYYSDWVRAQQQYKKDIVFKQAVYFRDKNLMNKIGEETSVHGKNELENQQRLIGRKGALLGQVASDINNKKPEPARSKGVDFKTIKTEIPQVSKESDYKDFVNKGGTKVHEHFRDKVIRKDYPANQEWGELGPPYDKSGKFVEKEYDTKWQISRMMVDHEYIFRHNGGQINVEYQKIANPIGTVHELFDEYVEKKSGGVNFENLLSSIMLEKLNEDLASGENKKNFKFDKFESNEDSVDRNTALIEEAAIGEAKNWDGLEWGTVEWNKQPKYLEADTKVNNSFTHTWVYKPGDASKKQMTITFAGWCLDEAGKYLVGPDDKLGFNVKLFPRYLLTVSDVTA